MTVSKKQLEVNKKNARKGFKQHVLGYDIPRKVAKLYLPPNATSFGCRHCYNLSYTSRNRPTANYTKTLQQIADLLEKPTYWTYNGKPTKKAKRLDALQKRVESCEANVEAWNKRRNAAVLRLCSKINKLSNVNPNRGT